MMTNLRTTSGLVEAVDVDQNSVKLDHNGYVIAFSVFSHSEGDEDYYHIYHLTRRHMQNDRRIFDATIEDIEKREPVRLARGGTLGAGIGAHIGANDAFVGRGGPSSARSNMIRSAKNGAMRGLIVASVVGGITSLIRAHLAESNSGAGDEFVYVNASGGRDSTYVGPWKY